VVGGSRESAIGHPTGGGLAACGATCFEEMHKFIAFNSKADWLHDEDARLRKEHNNVLGDVNHLWEERSQLQEDLCGVNLRVEDVELLREPRGGMNR
jgi:hypothetical protein